MQHTIFVLTLEGDKARRQPLLDQLDEFGLAYELWFGLDGRNGISPDMEALIDRKLARKKLHREMGNAEFACALSHHFIYKEILQRELSMAIILEDDAIIGAGFKSFCDMRDRLFCDLLLLDHDKAFVSAQKMQPISAEICAFRTTLAPDLSTGYAISNAGARMLVEKSLPISAPADWPWDVSKMETWAITPRIVDHPSLIDSHSNIRSERGDTVFYGQKTRFLRRAYWGRKLEKRKRNLIKRKSRLIS